MPKKRLIRTVIETVEVIRIHPPAGVSRMRCPICEADMPALTVEQVAALRQVSVRDVYRAVEAGHVHAADLPDGSLRICPASLGFGKAAAPRALPDG